MTDTWKNCVLAEGHGKECLNESHSEKSAVQNTGWLISLNEKAKHKQHLKTVTEFFGKSSKSAILRSSCHSKVSEKKAYLGGCLWGAFEDILTYMYLVVIWKISGCFWFTVHWVRFIKSEILGSLFDFFINIAYLFFRWLTLLQKEMSLALQSVPVLQ